MKLRQKLAAVLATAMVVSAVPVVTMADSNNKIVKASEVVKKDTRTTSGGLKVKFEDSDYNEEEFFLDVTNAEWLELDSYFVDSSKTGVDISKITEDNEDDAQDTIYILGQKNATVKYISDKKWEYTIIDAGGDTWKVIYTRQNKTSMKVNVTPPNNDQHIQLPLPVKLTGGTASVKMFGNGSDTTITENSWVFASTGEKAAALTVGDLKSFYDEGELSALTLKETYVGSLKANDLLLKIELDDTDFEFRSGSNVVLEGSYGFDFDTLSSNSDNKKAGKVDTKNDDKYVKFTVDDEDPSTGYLWISKTLAAAASASTSSLGRIEITGLEVDADEDDLELGNLNATIKHVSSYDDDNSGDYTFTGCDGELDQTYDVAVANIANYGAYIKMKDEKAVDIIAGRDEETVFEVIEAVDDVFVGGRTITIDLEDDITNDKDYQDSYFWIKNEPDAIKDLIDDDSNEIVNMDKIEIVWHDDKAPATGVEGKADAIKITLNEEDKDEDALNKNKDIDKFKVKVMTYVPVKQMDKKELKVVASMRGVDEFKEATIANVIKPFDVAFDTTTLKVGLQDQVMNKITITETDKEMFMKGKINFDIAEGSKEQDGITIEDKGDLTVTGDLKRTDFDVATDRQVDYIELKRQSKSASSLEIANMEVTIDRTVPEGTYELKLSGNAIDEHGGSISYKDLIAIGTLNTQDISATNGLAKGTATFVIGESKYTLNGVEATMDAASYIQDPGYTMVPVRYVAEAFGVAKSDIFFGNGAVTIIAGNRTVQLTNGSNIAIVNGASVAMSTKVVIKDSRTYAPIGEIAKILGVASTWDNTAKTATFTN